MIDNQIIDFAKTNLLFPRRIDDYFNYGVLIFPICLLAGGSVLIYNVVQFSNEGLVFPALVFLIVGIPFLRFTWKRLKENLRFQVFTTGMSLKENMEVSYQVLEECMKIKTIEKNEDYGFVVCLTRISGFSWGENITIICVDDKVLINSKPLQPITFYKDRQNIKRIMEGIEKKMKPSS